VTNQSAKCDYFRSIVFTVHACMHACMHGRKHACMHASHEAWCLAWWVSLSGEIRAPSRLHHPSCMPSSSWFMHVLNLVHPCVHPSWFMSIHQGIITLSSSMIMTMFNEGNALMAKTRIFLCEQIIFCRTPSTRSEKQLAWSLGCLGVRRMCMHPRRTAKDTSGAAPG
jgi:hypothetical protein